MHLGGMPAKDALEIMLRPDRELSGQVDGNEVIHLVSRWRTTEGTDPRDHAYRLSCDPRIGFLPILIASEFDFHKRPAESSRQVIKVNWVRHGQAWYVSSADYRIYCTGNPLKGTRVQVAVTQFDPKATISDAEFTLEGLGVTEGMTVIDQVAGVTYQYGAPVKTLEELAEPLEEAEFVEKVADQQGESPQGMADPNISQTPAARTSTDGCRHLRTGLILALMLLVAVAAFIGYRRAGTWRQRKGSGMSMRGSTRFVAAAFLLLVVRGLRPAFSADDGTHPAERGERRVTFRLNSLCGHAQNAFARAAREKAPALKDQGRVWRRGLRTMRSFAPVTTNSEAGRQMLMIDFARTTRRRAGTGTGTKKTGFSLL
jgi:hypothetical protein